MVKYDFNITIIGGGIIGLSIAYSLSKRIKNILLLEENDKLGQEISARNSEVIHAGIYYEKKSLKSFHSLGGTNYFTIIAKIGAFPLERLGSSLLRKKILP